MKKLSLATLETQQEHNDLAKILREEQLYVDEGKAFTRIVFYNMLQFYHLLAPIMPLICGLVLLEKIANFPGLRLVDHCLPIVGSLIIPIIIISMNVAYIFGKIPPN